MQTSTLKIIGKITVIVFTVFGFAALIMSGISYQVIDTDWAVGPWRHLAPVNLAVTIYCLFSSIFGFLVFTCCSQMKPFIVLYLVIMLSSLLFTWSIGIFASIGGTIKNKVDDVLGCKSPLTGVLELWRNVDNYYQLADSILCSSLCQCLMYSEVFDEFQYDFLTSETYQTIVRTDHESRPVLEENQRKFNFQSCSDEARQVAYDVYISNPNNTKQYIKPDHFADYWKGIEERFECVGWCNLNYTSMFDLQNHIMGKYVFSDVNRGVVKYPGCLYKLTHWIPSLIGAIGGCLIFAAFVQSINWFVAFALVYKPFEEPGNNKIDFNKKPKISEENQMIDNRPKHI